MNSLKSIVLAILVSGVTIVGTASSAQARIFYPDRCAGTGDLFGSGKWFDKPWYCYILP